MDRNGISGLSEVESSAAKVLAYWSYSMVIAEPVGVTLVYASLVIKHQCSESSMTKRLSGNKKSTRERQDRRLVWFVIGGVWLTGVVGLFLLMFVTTNSPVFPWIVVVGVLLAVYMEVYWAYAALQSGLLRERSRHWPEDSGKVSPSSNHQGGKQATNPDSPN
jgi:hypothetical protein